MVCFIDTIPVVEPLRGFPILVNSIKYTFHHLVYPVHIYLRLYSLTQILLVTNQEHFIHIRQFIRDELNGIRNIGMKQVK